MPDIRLMADISRVRRDGRISDGCLTSDCFLSSFFQHRDCLPILFLFSHFHLRFISWRFFAKNQVKWINGWYLAFTQTFPSPWFLKQRAKTGWGINYRWQNLPKHSNRQKCLELDKRFLSGLRDAGLKGAQEESVEEGEGREGKVGLVSQKLKGL